MNTDSIDNEPIQYHCSRYNEIAPELFVEWQSLSEKWQDHPFQSPIWARAGIFKNDYSELYLLTASKGEKYVGFFPFKLSHQSKGRILKICYCLPWHEVMPIGFLLDPNETDSNHLLIIQNFLSKLPKWHIVILGFVNSKRQSLNALQSFVPHEINGCFGHSHVTSEICGHKSFDDFIALLSPKWRAQYRRTHRKLVESKKTKIEHFTEFNEISLTKIRKRIVGIYQESWKVNSNETPINITTEEGHSFFSNLLDGFSKTHGLHIMLATYEGEDAAFYVGLHQAGNYSSLQTAYKEKFKKTGIGFLVQMENFKYTINSNFKTNNLLAYQQYKQHLTNKTVPFVWFKLYNHGLKAKMVRWASLLKSRVERIKKRASGMFKKQKSHSSV
jgi:hypothetical protein